MLVSGTIPNMFNGVSQQSAPLRHPSQGEAQVNAYATIAKGIGKRPPTQHIAKLTASSRLTSFFHTINRDATERYKVVITNGDLFVYDLDGVEMTVSFPSGKAYLTASTPRDDFVAVTVADHTFILNRNIVTAMTASVVAGSITGQVQEFTDLTAPTGTGNIYEITGSPASSFDNYYVKDDAVFATGVYVETAQPGITYVIDGATMPHKLVRTGVGTFSFAPVTWDDRLVGDDSSNPQPSFIGQALSDMFFFRNRLGFTSNEAYVLSRPGDYFNYWVGSVTAALDTDPVDSEVSHTKVSIINFAVPFNKAMMLFSEQTQFQVTGGDTFTQSNNKADVVTEFTSSVLCRPVSMNTSLFFVTNRSGFSGVREYYVEQDTISNDAADVTAHVPDYIPEGVVKLAECGAEDCLFAHANTNRAYVYKFYWGDKEKLQSAWSYFEFDEGDTILDINFIETVAYFIIERADGVYLEYMDLQTAARDPGFTYTVLLDRRVFGAGTYSAGTGLTTWTLPYEDDGDIRVILADGWGSNVGTRLTTSRPSSTTIAAVGDYSGGDVYIGRAYEFRYEFSEIHARDPKGAPIAAKRLQLLNMYVAFQNTGYFRVEVTPKARDTYTYPFTGKILGDSTLVLGSNALQDGTFKFPVKSRNENTTIALVNDSHLPSTFQSAEWEGDMIIQSQRLS